MRLKSIYKSVFLTTVVLFAGCSGDEFSRPAGSSREAVAVTLTVSRPGDSSTRTILGDREDGGLKSVWTADDKLLVVTADGTKAGELALKSGGNSTKGIFAGTLSLADGDKAMVWYLGASNYLGASDTESKPYASAILSGDKVTSLSIDLESDELRGTFHDLKRADFLVKEIAFTVKDDKGYVKGDANGNDGEVALTPLMAMAHFSLDFGEEVKLTDDATLTVTAEGENQLLGSAVVSTPGASSEMTVATDAAGYSLPVNSTEIYLPFVPATYTLKFVLKNGDKTYEGALAQNTLTAGLYYQEKTDGSTGNGYKGISVSLTDKTSSDEDDELVGPVFEVNGKKFRFTRANLSYQVSTGQWRLLENQYDYLYHAGWDIGNTPSSNTEDIIDLFGWGATGLYDAESGEYARQPQYWKDSGQYGTYPTQNDAYNGANNGQRLRNGLQNTVFDWGTAYGEGRNGKYFTLSSAQWSQIKNTYFFAGATITDLKDPLANKNYKKAVYGCLIFPEGSKEGAIALLRKSGYEFVNETKLSDNLSFSGTDYQYFKYDWIKLTVEQFQNLEKLGVVFLPEAGRRAVTSLTYTEGAYWTSTPDLTGGGTKTATAFRFKGHTSEPSSRPSSTTVASIFELKNTYQRTQSSAVRLVKEVPADYKDPFAE